MFDLQQYVVLIVAFIPLLFMLTLFALEWTLVKLFSPLKK